MDRELKVRREKTIEEVLDSYNISWRYDDNEKVEETIKMFKNLIVDEYFHNQEEEK